MRHSIIIGLSGLPRVMLVGLLILIAGGTLDLLYHAAPASWASVLDVYLGHEGMRAHLVTLAGMIVTLFGVFTRRTAA